MSNPPLLPATDNPKEVSIAATLLPWRRDDSRARFMGYLACGFDIEESLYMIGKDYAWLDEQRLDESFSSIELKVPEIRKQLSKEYIEIDFYRNFRLVLEKDYRILEKSIKEEVLSKQEHDYLLKLRSAYTPQQLQILTQVISGASDGGWNFAQWVTQNQDKIRGVEVSRTDSIRVISDDKKSEDS